MNWAEYTDTITQTSMNYDTTGWHQDYFLMLDDPAAISAETGSYCHSDCTKHTVTVENTSGAEQVVHIGAHIWQDRSYGTPCSDAKNNWGNHHEFWDNGGGQRIGLDGGAEDGWMPPILMQAGEVRTIHALFAWQR